MCEGAEVVMKKILLTGGKGFFGSRFVAQYRHTYDIVSTDVQDLNVLDPEGIDRAFTLIKPDIVIHAAAIALTGFCNENPEKCREINVTGALNIARAAEKFNSSMIFISSEQVFNGNEEPGPYKETDIPVPDTVYGKNKLEAEGELAKILEKLWVLRFTWMFGVPQKRLPVVQNIIWDSIKSLMSGDKIYASPREFRGLTYVDEMVEQFDKVFELPYDTYHMGARNDLSRYDIIHHIFEEVGAGERIDELLIEDNSRYLERPRDVRLDTAKITSFGFSFSDSTEAVSRCIKDYSLYARSGIELTGRGSRERFL